MKQLIDFDGLFDEKLAEYMQLNQGKYTEKQWESIIPKLYRKFGDTFIPKAGNTPKGYYAAMSGEELVETLVRHVKEGVPVSDFLCGELEARRPSSLVTLLSQDDPELLTLAVNLLGDDPRAFDGYFALLGREETDENVVEAVCEQLKMGADAAKDRALACYERGVRPELMLEILSRVKSRDEHVFEILLTAFRTAGDEELPMRASYLAAYGDARALPVLLEFIDRDDINFLEFRELKYAIEALGGEYTRPRDFSEDPYFQELLSQQQDAVDLMSPKKSDA